VRCSFSVRFSNILFSAGGQRLLAGESGLVIG